MLSRVMLKAFGWTALPAAFLVLDPPYEVSGGLHLTLQLLSTIMTGVLLVFIPWGYRLPPDVPQMKANAFALASFIAVKLLWTAVSSTHLSLALAVLVPVSMIWTALLLAVLKQR